MKRILILGCIGILFLAGIISTTTFAVLYMNSQNEIKIKNVELSACMANVAEEAPTCPEVPTTTSTDSTFKDDGQSIEIRYPNTWVGVLNTKLSTDFAYEPEYGKVISKYEYTLRKSGVALKFTRILGGVDGFPNGLKASTHDWKEISGTNLVRYSEKGENNWRYVSSVDCSDLGEPFFTVEEVASFSVCVGSFFPGFGTDGASTATIETGDVDLLDEADQIAKSALN